MNNSWSNITTNLGQLDVNVHNASSFPSNMVEYGTPCGKHVCYKIRFQHCVDESKSIILLKLSYCQLQLNHHGQEIYTKCGRYATERSSRSTAVLRHWAKLI